MIIQRRKLSEFANHLYVLFNYLKQKRKTGSVRTQFHPQWVCTLELSNRIANGLRLIFKEQKEVLLQEARACPLGMSGPREKQPGLA